MSSNVRLLVIEDEVRIAEILRSALSRAGFAVDASALVPMRARPWSSIPTMPPFSISGSLTATA